MNNQDVILFALNSSKKFGQRVSEALQIGLSEQEERDFEDGEHKTRSLVNVRNREVFVIQSLYSEPGISVNDKLCRLLFFIGSLKDAGATSVTTIVPYLCYARKDRKTKFRDPVTTRYVATLMEAIGMDRIVTLDVHNLQAYQNAFRHSNEHLEANNLFVHYFTRELADEEEIVVLSPDLGGIKRAEKFRASLSQAKEMDIPMAVMGKWRSMGVVSGQTTIYGDVRNKTVIIIDDMISSGTTLSRAAKACKEAGAKKVYAAATHGAFTPNANKILADEALNKIVVTNSIPPFRLVEGLKERKVTVLDIAPLFAEAIHRIWRGGSLTDLLKYDLPAVVFDEKN